MAGIVLVMAQPGVDRALIGQIIAVTFGIHYVIALIGSKGKHFSWIVFALITLLLLLH
ncbi:hypothetical protein [Shewanella amazonensis]|uniref:hypothetical protein n=1 Tax=Shewanella amazonensis TaxID=60478 RepID=UPI00031C6818|nr:hypothetical protein [Shewanella amazonensis]